MEGYYIEILEILQRITGEEGKMLFLTGAPRAPREVGS